VSETIIWILKWWFGLFGITDPAYTSLGITIVASALLLLALYVAAILIVGVIAGIADRR
jgi:hypothetical protein